MNIASVYLIYGKHFECMNYNFKALKINED